MCTHYLGNRNIIKTSKGIRWQGVCGSLSPSNHTVLDLGGPGKRRGPRGPSVTPGATGRRCQDSGDWHTQGHIVEKPRGEEVTEGSPVTNRASEKVSMPPGVLSLAKCWGREGACSSFCLS